MPIFHVSRASNHSVKAVEYKGKLPMYLTAHGAFPCEFGKMYVASDCLFAMIVAPSKSEAERLGDGILLCPL